MRKLQPIVLAFLLILSAGTFAQKFDKNQMPKPGPAPKVNLGKPQTFTLPNGLKVMVVEDNKLPRFSAQLTIDNEPFAEGDKKGVSGLMGSLLGKGSTKTAKNAFEAEVDFMGAFLELNAGGAYASGLSKYFDRLMEMLGEAALMPNFTQEELDKERDKAIEGLKSGEKSVPAIAGRVSLALSYGANHPFGEYETIDRYKGVSLEDIKTTYNKFFVPGNAYLVIIGDVKYEHVKNVVTKQFELWKKATAPVISYTDPKNVLFTQINFVDVPHAVQAEVALMNLTNLKMTDPDYFPVLIANEIVGGSFESYLNKTLREVKGWTYGARSRVGASKNINRFTAGASLKQATVDSAVVEILTQINKIRKEFVKEDDLKNAKATFAGDFIRESAKPRTVSNYALRIETEDLPADFYEKYLANLEKVTKEDVMRVAKKYFMTDNARIVVAAKGSEVLEKLEATKIPIFYFDQFGNKTEKPEQKKADASVTAQSVIENYLKAIGGKDKAEAAKTMKMVGTANIPGAPAPISATMKVGQGKMSNTMEMMGMTVMKQVATSEKGYMMQQGQKSDMKEEEYKKSSEKAYPITETVLLKSKDLVLSGIEAVDGVDAYVIKSGDTKYFYDTKSFLKIQEVNEVEAQGQKMLVTNKLKDYRDVKGLKVPFIYIINQGMELEFKFSEILINEGVTDADFE
jgi:zinc protease